jgi:regulator of ribonuclease activity A
MFATTDLCDENEDRLADGRLQVAAPGWLGFGSRIRFSGPAVTLRLPDDNALVRSTLEQPGHGRVLVIDAGASVRCALVGGKLARLGQDNGWSGAIVNGGVRDADELDACKFGVRALHLVPRRSSKRGLGERDVVLSFAGVFIAPGAIIYADRDGWLVSDQPLQA